jgi:DNA-binding MarR family transcriptional regulator
MLKALTRRRWIDVKSGRDRRQKLLRLTSAGRDKFEQSRQHWQRAQTRLQQALSEPAWNQLGALLAEVARSSEKQRSESIAGQFRRKKLSQRADLVRESSTNQAW